MVVEKKNFLYSLSFISLFHLQFLLNFSALVANRIRTWYLLINDSVRWCAALAITPQRLLS